MIPTDEQTLAVPKLPAEMSKKKSSLRRATTMKVSNQTIVQDIDMVEKPVKRKTDPG